MPRIRKLLISPRPDLATEIAQMQSVAGLDGKLIIALQIRTGVADTTGKPQFLGTSREESANNGRVELYLYQLSLLLADTRLFSRSTHIF